MKKLGLFAAFLFLSVLKLNAQMVQWVNILDISPPGMGGAHNPVISSDGVDLISGGSIINAITLGNQTFQRNTLSSSYLAKHNQNGSLMWARHLVGAWNLKITTDGNKNII